MPSLAIVINLNIFKYGRKGLFLVLKFFMTNQFRLDDVKKGFGHAVIPTVALPTHALDKLLIIKNFPKIIACVLNSLIRMNYEPRIRPPVF